MLLEGTVRFYKKVITLDITLEYLGDFQITGQVRNKDDVMKQQMSNFATLIFKPFYVGPQVSY